MVIGSEKMKAAVLNSALDGRDGVREGEDVDLAGKAVRVSASSRGLGNDGLNGGDDA